jgi:hypothetical protein
MASLRELQRSFAAALRQRGDASVCPVQPAANLGIYRNNAALNFRGALQAEFPVLRRRVGDDYFAQLVFHYRERFPSRSGDLHWVGREFPAFLREHLAAGDYAWLADLATLEWARESAALEPVAPAIGVGALGTFAPEQLEHVEFSLQPSLRLVDSPYPVFSVWLANRDENAPPTDQSAAGESGMVLGRADGVEVARLAPDLFSYLYAVKEGASLGAAMSQTGLDPARLTQVLAHLFGEGLVTGVALPAAR